MTRTPSWIIRPAVDTDAPAILNCLADAFAPYRSSYTEEAFLDTVLSAETIKRCMKNMKIFVAEDPTSGTIIGTVACNLVGAEEGHLRGMAILSSYIGSGVAQQLLETAEDKNAFGSRSTRLSRSAELSIFTAETDFGLPSEPVTSLVCRCMNTLKP